MVVSPLIRKSLRFTWDAHKANPADLTMATLGMILNNVLNIWGLWMMLFAGKPNNEYLLHYFLAMQSFVPLAWGVVQFFAGGLYTLSEIIENGAFETMMATPRHPLLLTAISRSNPTGLGDILQGLITLLFLFCIAPADYALRVAAITSLSIVGMAAMFILSGSLAFFVGRGNEAAQLLNQVNLALSGYPMGMVLQDRGRMILALFPAAAVAIFPLDFIHLASWTALAKSALSLIVLTGVSLGVFHLGIRSYRGNSFIGFKG